MPEVSTTLGAGLLAVPYLAGSGTMTVTPSSWPNGLPFPTTPVFSIAVKFGSGPKFPVYTVTGVATSGGNKVFTVAIEAGTDQSADAGSVVSEVQSTRSLNALISQSGGGGGASYKYQYFAAAVSNNSTENQVSFNGANGLAATGMNGPIGGFTSMGLSAFGTSGNDQATWIVRVPPSWDGSDITLDLDFGFSSSPAAGTFTPYASNPALGTSINGPVTWTAGTPVPVVSTGGVGVPAFGSCQLIVPAGVAVAGERLFIALNRPVDAFGGVLYVFGVAVGIKY